MVSPRTTVSHTDCCWKVQSGKHSDHDTGSLLVAVLFSSEWSFFRWNLTMQWRLICNSLCGSGCHGILNSCLNLASARNPGMSNHAEALPSLSLSPALFPGFQFFVFITSNIFLTSSLTNRHSCCLWFIQFVLLPVFKKAHFSFAVLFHLAYLFLYGSIGLWVQSFAQAKQVLTSEHVLQLCGNSYSLF